MLGFQKVRFSNGRALAMAIGSNHTKTGPFQIQTFLCGVKWFWQLTGGKMVHVMDGWHGSRHGYLTNMCPPKWPDNCDYILS